MECKACHRTLVADVEDDVVVGVYTVAQPSHLGRHLCTVALALHQVFTSGTYGKVVLVEVDAAGIGIVERALVCAGDIRIIGTVGKGSCLAQ